MNITKSNCQMHNSPERKKQALVKKSKYTMKKREIKMLQLNSILSKYLCPSLQIGSNFLSKVKHVQLHQGEYSQNL